MNMDDWNGFMNNQQKIESRIIKDKLKEKPVDKDYPIEFKYYVESDGLCPCPVCDVEMDLIEMTKKDNNARCPHCGQLYKINIEVS